MSAEQIFNTHIIQIRSVYKDRELFIIMDFIIKLLKSENKAINTKYNNILVVVNRLTKYIYLILYNERSMMKQTVWIILDKIIQYYEILELIMSDRNKIFTNKF